MPSPRTTYDCIVIGGGHNGLTAAAYLAKAALRVIVLERRNVLGGAAATEEIFPGFLANSGSTDAGMFLPQIVSDLHLESYGLSFLESPAVVTALAPAGEALTLWRDSQRARESIARFSKLDADRYPAFLEQVRSFAAILETMLSRTPPGIPELNAKELLPWIAPALELKRLGERQMMAFVRALPMPVSDFLDEWFETPLLKAALGYAGVIGSSQGPLSSGTAFLTLYHAIGAGQAGFRASRSVRGGTGALSTALAGAAQAHGAQICTGQGVQRILLEGDRAAGVLLEDGEQVSARVILSSAGPRRTFFDLVGAQNLPVSFVREVKNIKFNGTTSRLNLALSGLPRFPGMQPEQLSGRLLLCPNLEAMERAHDDAKYGRISQTPVLEVSLPSLLDDSLAPPGQHVLSADVRYTPYHLSSAGWDSLKEDLSQKILTALESFAPGLCNLVLAQQLLTPVDLEREYGLAEGGIYHGQMGLDQLLFMRPAAGYGQYRTPVDNLYLCGAGAHPGGGVTGAPGFNAAREVLKIF